MKFLFLSLPGRKTIAALALLAATLTSGRAQTTQYNATTVPFAQQATTSYGQVVTLAGGANNRYSISGMTLNLYQLAGTTTSYLYVDFYTGADTSPTATDALDNATYITTEAFQILGQATTGNYLYQLNFPASFTLNTGTFFVDVALTDTTPQRNFQSTGVIQGSFASAAPTVGTSPGFVWNDTNQDGIFAGSEQTRFGGSTASIRMSINASIVPEPTTNAALACGGVLLLAGWGLRRRAVCRA